MQRPEVLARAAGKVAVVDPWQRSITDVAAREVGQLARCRLLDRLSDDKAHVALRVGDDRRAAAPRKAAVLRLIARVLLLI